MHSERTKRNISRTLLTAAGGLLAAAGTRAYLRYRRDLKAAYTRVSSGSKLISTPCGPIEYADIGTGSPVLVIHGAGGGFDQALEFAQPLIESGFRVIAPSRFGYLGTPLQADSSPEAQADAHAYLLEVLELKKVGVIGVSAGAPSAMQLCLRHPEKCSAMVLGVPLAWSGRPEDSAPRKSPAARKFLLNTMLSSDFVFWSLSKIAPDAMIKTILGTPPENVKKAGAAEQTRIAEFLAHIEPISKRKHGLENETAIAESLHRYALENVRVPTLVFAVENCLYKTYPGACYTADHIPGARMISYPDGGHLAVGHQAELWPEIQKFLRTAADTPAPVEIEDYQQVLQD